jgi:hypothetical protein
MVYFYTEKFQILNLFMEIGYPDWCYSPPWFIQINSTTAGLRYTVNLIPPIQFNFYFCFILLLFSCLCLWLPSTFSSVQVLLQNVSVHFSSMLSTCPSHLIIDFIILIIGYWPPLLSSGQSSWVRFPAQPDFLRSSESGTGSTQPREDNWGTTWMKK